MTTHLKHSDQLNALIRSSVGGERIHLARNVAYGGAAVALAILAGLTQVGASALPLKVSVYAASLTLPSWLLLGALYEYYIYLGAESYAHLMTPFMFHISAWGFASAGLGMIVTTAGITWYLVPSASIIFIVASLACIALAAVFHFHLARWWFSPDGPGDHNGGPSI